MTATVEHDHRAVKALREVAKKVDAIYHGIVPSEVMTFLYKHAQSMAAEIVHPLITTKAGGKVEVPEIIVSVDRNNRKQLGHFKIGRDGLGLQWRISMNVLHLSRPRGDVLSTLLHEIMHAVQHAHGNPGRSTKYHNREFTTWCERLGIPTDDRGHDRGITPDGVFAAYLKRHGIEGTIRLLSRQETGRPGPTKMARWACGCTNIRCAVELDATCDACGEKFVEGAKAERERGEEPGGEDD